MEAVTIPCILWCSLSVSSNLSCLKASIDQWVFFSLSTGDQDCRHSLLQHGPGTQGSQLPARKVLHIRGSWRLSQERLCETTHFTGATLDNVCLPCGNTRCYSRVPGMVCALLSNVSTFKPNSDTILILILNKVCLSIFPTNVILCIYIIFLLQWQAEHALPRLFTAITSLLVLARCCSQDIYKPEQW